MQNASNVANSTASQARRQKQSAYYGHPCLCRGQLAGVKGNKKPVCFSVRRHWRAMPRPSYRDFIPKSAGTDGKFPAQGNCLAVLAANRRHAANAPAAWGLVDAFL